jgi:hypothetical protein
VVGMGGEWVRFTWALFVDAVDQPAARNPGVLRTELLTLIKRSPIPSLIVER